MYFDQFNVIKDFYFKQLQGFVFTFY